MNGPDGFEKTIRAFLVTVPERDPDRLRSLLLDSPASSRRDRRAVVPALVAALDEGIENVPRARWDEISARLAVVHGLDAEQSSKALRIWGTVLDDQAGVASGPGDQSIDTSGLRDVGESPPGDFVDRQAGEGPGSIESTAGLGNATLVLLWVATAALFVLAFASLRRSWSFNKFRRGEGSWAFDDFENLVWLVNIGAIVLQISALVVLSIWSERLVRNAQELGVYGVRPGLACGGWYIPIGNMWVPWAHLRTATVGLRGATKNLDRWQGAWIGFVVLAFLTRFVFTVQPTESSTEFASQLSNHAVVSLLQSIVFAIAALFAMRAIRDMESAVNERVAAF